MSTPIYFVPSMFTQRQDIQGPAFRVVEEDDHLAALATERSRTEAQRQEDWKAGALAGVEAGIQFSANLHRQVYGTGIRQSGDTQRVFETLNPRLP